MRYLYILLLLLTPAFGVDKDFFAEGRIFFAENIAPAVNKKIILRDFHTGNIFGRVEGRLLRLVKTRAKVLARDNAWSKKGEFIIIKVMDEKLTLVEINEMVSSKKITLLSSINNKLIITEKPSKAAYEYDLKKIRKILNIGK